MVQTGDPYAPGYYLGAGHDPSLANETCSHGTPMTGILTPTAAYHMAPLNPQRSALIPQIEAAMHDAITVQPLREDAGEQPPGE